MIIDNDGDVLDVMEEALTYEGFQVNVTKSTDDIFADLDGYKPDILLIDYLLDGINGGELCHQVKSNPSTSALPVVIISAYPKVILSLGTYNCDRFIAKPFDLDELVDQINSLLISFSKNSSNGLQERY